MTSRRLLRVLAVSLGLLLVFSPFWLGALHAGEDRHVYRAVSVTPDGDRLVYGENHSTVFRAGDTALAEDVHCVAEPYGPACALGGDLVGNDTVRTGLNEDRLERDTYVYHEGSLYAITVDPLSDGEGAVYDAEPASMRDVLASITSADPSLTDAQRRAVETGRARTFHEPRTVPRFVAYEGSYYLLFDGGAVVPQRPLAADWFGGTAPFLGTLTGVGLLVLGVRPKGGIGGRL